MNARPDELPANLQALLDARRDPLDEPEVQQWLLDRPEQLETFARWRSALGSAPVSVGTPAPRRLQRLLPLAAVLLTAAVVATRHCVIRAATAPLPRPDFAAAGRIVSFSTCTAVIGVSDAAVDQLASWSTSTQAGMAAAHQVETLSSTSPPSASVPLCVTLTRTEGNQPTCPRP